MTRTLFSILALSVFVAWAAPRVMGQDAAAPSVDEIVQRTNHAAYYKGKDGRARVTMTIKDEQGRTRTKQFVILRRDVPAAGAAEDDDTHAGDQKFYVYFFLPPDERRTVFMVWKHLDREDDRWLYLPALDLVKQIASTEKRTSFVGSHFFYEDVSGRNINADTHQLAETSANYYVLNNVPKDPNSVEFSRFTMWVHRESFIPVKIEYFDRNGQKYRAYTAEKVETIDGYPTVTRAKMQDLRTGGETTIDYTNVKYNLGIPDSVFTERYLRMPPQEYLR